MKKLLLLVLTLTMILSLAACTNNDKSKDKPEQETELTLDQKKELVKNDAIAIMEQDSREDPTTMIEAFTGDFKATGFNAASGIDSLWKKGNVLAENSENGVYYYVHNDDTMYIIDEDSGNYAKLGEVEYEHSMTIFDYFDIDISFFISDDSDEESDDEIPILTADQLTVSDDLATCTIGNDYLAKVLRFGMEAMDYSDIEKTQAIEAMTATGTYTVADHKLFIDVQSTVEDTPIRITLTATENATDGLTLAFVLDGGVRTDDLTIPTKMEMAYQNIKFNGSKAVSGIFSMKLEAGAEQIIEGSKLTFSMLNNLSYTFDLTKEGKPYINAKSNSKQTQTYMGQTKTDNDSQEFTIDFSKTENVLTVKTVSDGKTDIITADSVVFETPAETIPTKVTELAK